MKIKELIDKKIQEYKDDFYKECGFNLIAVPQVGLNKVPIYELVNESCAYLDTTVDILSSTSKAGVKAKEFIIGFAIKMGYTIQQIRMVLSIDIKTIKRLYSNFNSKLIDDKIYKSDFYSLVEYIYIQIGNGSLILDAPDTKTHVLDTIFIDYLDENVGKTKSDNSEEKIEELLNEEGISGTEAIKRYLWIVNRSRPRELIDFLIKNKYYDDAKTARTVISRLNKDKKINIKYYSNTKYYTR